jgi:hypothetical protein
VKRLESSDFWENRLLQGKLYFELGVDYNFGKQTFPKNKHNEKWIRCRDCARLKLSTNPPYCPFLKAFIMPQSLDQPWQCEFYKAKNPNFRKGRVKKLRKMEALKL